MPYIDQDSRKKIESSCLPYTDLPESIGEVNYMITQICLSWIAGMPKSYKTYNEIIGVLECAKLEFYRRAVSVYEDEKKDLNGDVYL